MIIHLSEFAFHENYFFEICLTKFFSRSFFIWMWQIEREKKKISNFSGDQTKIERGNRWHSTGILVAFELFSERNLIILWKNYWKIPDYFTTKQILFLKQFGIFLKNFCFVLNIKKLWGKKVGSKARNNARIFLRREIQVLENKNKIKFDQVKCKKKFFLSLWDQTKRFFLPKSFFK